MDEVAQDYRRELELQKLILIFSTSASISTAIDIPHSVIVQAWINDYARFIAYKTKS